MARRSSVLRLHLLDERGQIDLDRVSLVIDRLATRRRVEGDSPEWRILYEVDDPSEAMGLCARDLGQIDADWCQYLDFSVLRLERPRR